jgi:hypothetical protein
MNKKKILKKAIMVSGAIVRTLVGIGASALLFFAFKKKKKEKKI